MDFIVDSTLERIYLNENQHLSIPQKWRGGEVKTAADAYKIAEPEFLFINNCNIELEKPFHINLVNDSIWIVYAYPQPVNNDIYMGGGMYMEILKSNGGILKMIIEE